MSASENVRYIKIQKIGEGAYGIIYKAQDVQTEEIVALKKFKLSDNEGVPSCALREISILNQLNHPNIIKLISQIIINKKLHLVMNYYDMDLTEYLKFNHEESHLKNIIYKILLAVEFIHNRKIIHRDLQPNNILITNNEPVLIDFGLSRVLSPNMTPGVTQLWYRAPELLSNCNTYDYAIDMWSLGCIIAEIALNKPLFMGSSEIHQLLLIKNIINGNEWFLHNSQFAKLNNLFIDLINKLLQVDPSKRITSKQALQHPFFLDQFAFIYNKE
ncbi:unnamed protein product (macronuclear) [Paramecium tetraurelia]|uniref:Cyclin-dependent kinase 2 homolog n=1 Tax=Paramecium tetraurelia TaxID=5888 RepID=A0DZS0_PARTE|nr:uncharacterized protein GSPATT00021705001 [Paramecium tetraurelia]CAK88537.1 unnamed protein product [Paramecium tetraurelia]|eukprot:XP_001455934.1 hypothetical protein (macronuclear) [Paramecium tetraurelia strain d4-2]